MGEAAGREASSSSSRQAVGKADSPAERVAQQGSCKGNQSKTRQGSMSAGRRASIRFTRVPLLQGSEGMGEHAGGPMPERPDTFAFSPSPQGQAGTPGSGQALAGKWAGRQEEMADVAVVPRPGVTNTTMLAASVSPGAPLASRSPLAPICSARPTHHPRGPSRPTGSLPQGRPCRTRLPQRHDHGAQLRPVGVGLESAARCRLRVARRRHSQPRSLLSVRPKVASFCEESPPPPAPAHKGRVVLSHKGEEATIRTNKAQPPHEGRAV